MRVVRSQKDRTWDSIAERISKMKNARKNSDWAAIHDEFDEVNKIVVKAKMIILTNGLPKFYVKMLGELEDQVNLISKDKELLKKMKPVTERAFSRLKLAVKKHNKSYETEIADFRANPDKYAAEEVEDEDSSSESESDSDSKSSSSSKYSSDSSDDSSDSNSDEDSKPKRTVSKSKAKNDDDSDEDSLFGSDDGNDDSSDEEVMVEEIARVEIGKKRDFWLKKTVSAEKDKDDEESSDDEERKQRKAQRELEAQLKKKKRQEELEAANNRKTQSYDYKMTEEQLDKKVAELIGSRGRRSTDIRVTIRHLEVLTKIARVFGAKKEIPVLMHLISATFDSLHSMDDYLELNSWRYVCRCIHKVLNLLEQHKSYVLKQVKNEDMMGNAIVTEGDSAAASATAAATAAASGEKQHAVYVVGGLDAFFARLQEDYNRSLQQINSHTQVCI